MVGRQGRSPSRDPTSQAEPDQDELPACQPCHQDRKSQAAREAFPRCDGSIAQAPASVLVTNYTTARFQPTTQSSNPCIAWRGPVQSPGAQAPSAFITFVRSLDSIHPSSSLPSSPLSDGLGPGKTGRDRARWSRPGPVSDHAPVRKKMRRLAGCCSAVLTRGCSLAVWQSGTLAWHFGGLKHGPWQNAPYGTKY